MEYEICDRTSKEDEFVIILSTFNMCIRKLCFHPVEITKVLCQYLYLSKAYPSLEVMKFISFLAPLLIRVLFNYLEDHYQRLYAG